MTWLQGHDTFSDDEACRTYLLDQRRPEGFVCPPVKAPSIGRGNGPGGRGDQGTNVQRVAIKHR